MVDRMGFGLQKQLKQDLKRYPCFMKRAIKRTQRLMLLMIVGLIIVMSIMLSAGMSVHSRKVLAMTQTWQQQIHQQIENLKATGNTTVTLPPPPTLPTPITWLMVAPLGIILVGALAILLLDRHVPMYNAFDWRRRSLLWAHNHRFAVCEHCLCPLDEQASEGVCACCNNPYKLEDTLKKWGLAMYGVDVCRLHEHPAYIKHSRRRTRLALSFFIAGELLFWFVMNLRSTNFSNIMYIWLIVMLSLLPFILMYFWSWAEKHLHLFGAFACRWDAIVLASEHNMEICPACAYPLDTLGEQGNCPECGCHYDKTDVRRLWKFAALSMCNPSYLPKACYTKLREQWHVWKDEDVLGAKLKDQNKVLAWCEKQIPDAARS